MPRRTHGRRHFLAGASLAVCAGVLAWAGLFKHEPGADASTPAHAVPAIVQALVQSGDWIVRTGTGYEGTLVRKLGASRYSHIGIVQVAQDSMHVIHATTDDDPTQPDRVIVSTVQDFTHPRLASSWAVYRHEGLAPAEKRHMQQHAASLLGQAFVLGDRHDHRLYCTTIVHDGLPPQVQAQVQWQDVEVAAFHGQWLFPSALLALDGVRAVYESHAPRVR